MRLVNVHYNKYSCRRLHKGGKMGRNINTSKDYGTRSIDGENRLVQTWQWVRRALLITVCNPSWVDVRDYLMCCCERKHTGEKRKVIGFYCSPNSWHLAQFRPWNPQSFVFRRSCPQLQCTVAEQDNNVFTSIPFHGHYVFAQRELGGKVATDTLHNIELSSQATVRTQPGILSAKWKAMHYETSVMWRGWETLMPQHLTRHVRLVIWVIITFFHSELQHSVADLQLCRWGPRPVNMRD